MMTVEGRLRQLRTGALWVAGIGGLLCLAGALLEGEIFLRSYLFAYLFWLGVALGCAALLMIFHLLGARGAAPLRALLEAGTVTLPLMALLFLPLLAELSDLYPLARAPLGPWPFLVRALLYLVVWGLLALLLLRTASDERLHLGSRVGLPLYGLTATFAAMDWAMSLEPAWYSSMYGMLFIAGQLLSALALVVLFLALLPAPEWLPPPRLRRFGSLLLILTLASAYFALWQYLTVWMANLPHEVAWYLRRTQGGWEGVALLLVILYLLLPGLLVFARLQPGRRLLAVIAGLVLLLRLVDLFWLLMPAFDAPGFGLHWLHLAAPLALGGLWLLVFGRALQARVAGGSHVAA